MVVPTVAGQFADLSRSVNDLLARVNQIPFEQLGQSLNTLLVGANALTSGPETKQAIQSLSATLAGDATIDEAVGCRCNPGGTALPEIATSLQAMLNNTNKLVASTDSGYGDNSKFHRDLDRVMVQLNDMVQSLRVLADLLTRHPEALVRGSHQHRGGVMRERPAYGAGGSGGCTGELPVARTLRCLRWRRCRGLLGLAVPMWCCCTRSRWRGTSSGQGSSGRRRIIGWRCFPMKSGASRWGRCSAACWLRI